MKLIIFLGWFLSLISFQVFPQGTPGDRKDLHDLIEIRRKKFESYSRSLERKSGFFGNKTKKDLQHSNDVLSEIVETDNRIISLLNHVVDFRNYQKVNNTYDLFERNEQVQNLQHATDTLTKQVDALAISNAALKSKTRKLKWGVYGLSFLLVWLLIQRFRKKTAGR